MLNVNNYLRTPPSWAEDSEADCYHEALQAQGLVHGRNPSSRCPCGGHEGSEDANVVVYDDGVMCFSKHGFLPRREVTRLAGLTRGAGGPSLAELARISVDRCVPLDQLRSLLRHAISKRLDWPKRQTSVAETCLRGWAFRVGAEEEGWAGTQAAIFNGRYPSTAREFWTDEGLVQHHHVVASDLTALSGGGQYSYTVDRLELRREPKPALALQLAPRLAGLSDKGKAVVSAQIDRFLAGEQQAVAGSSLVALEIIDRPVPYLTGGWRMPTRSDELPKRTEIARLTSPPEEDPTFLERFIRDLRETFAFENEEALVRYIAYLIQPLLVVLQPGQFPGYYFSGPTKSGKTYLAGPLPELIYHHNSGAATYSTRFPESTYELAVQLEAQRGVLYVVFDDVIDLSDSQLKALDQLVTSPTLHPRVMQKGYSSRPNYTTFAFTAVAKSLPPETAGRLLEIHLTESRPDRIDEFYRRCRDAGPRLLRALYDAIGKVAEPGVGEFVPERRPGFGILKRILREAWGLSGEFAVATADDEMLELVCQALASNLGVTRDGGWRRFSFATLRDFYCTQKQMKATRQTVERKLHTALGYESTRRHPTYRETGYLTEEGRAYDIEIRSENQGHGQQRKFIYVREHRSETDPVSPRAAPRPRPSGNPTAAPPVATPAISPAPQINEETGACQFDLDTLEAELRRDPASAIRREEGSHDA